MRCIELARNGGPEVLALVERPDPVPGPGEVLVRNAAIGVNYIDIYHRTGAYPLPLPAVIGLEGAGTVAALGPGVSAVDVGERVAYPNAAGAYAELVRVAADRLVRVPDDLDLKHAAAAMLQGLTAHFLSHSVCAVARGDVVLVHAAAGGVGRLLTQMLVRRGAVVIGTVSSPVKEAVARAAGAQHVIRYTDEDFAAAARRLTGGDGVRVVYDAVGKATVAGSLAALGRRGWLVLYGQASGAAPPIDPAELLRRGSLFCTRPGLFDYIAAPAELHARAADLLKWLADGSLGLRIEAEFPLAQAGQAHALLETRQTAGKLLLVP